MTKEMIVVDDEPGLCKALGALFAEKGVRVTTANTAHDALDCAERVNADVVLLDLKLPDASGLDVLSTLKERFPNLRVIVISGIADEPTIQEAMQRGASDYLAKPFDFERCFYIAMGVETVTLADEPPAPEMLARVPAEIARRHQVLPLRWEQETLHLAMADPLDAKRLEELKMLLRCEIKPLAVSGGGLAAAIRQCYGAATAAPRRPRQASRAEAARESTPTSESSAADADVQRLVEELVLRVHAEGATNVHLGIGPQGPWVRIRIDGVLHDMPAASALKERYGGVVSHLKRIAHLDAAQRRVPQQGRIEFASGAVKLELRLSVVPTVRDEHVAIRLLEPTRTLPFEQLGLTEEQRPALAALLAKPAGLLLITGPSGAGISTSLYACLLKLNTGCANIVTIEDPMEYPLAGTTQIQVYPKAGLTCAEALRAITHHDSDIIMVGALHEQETASLAVRAALAGRLVLSSLHTSDASSVFTRLLDLGVEPFFLCSTVSGVLAQRLVRTLCPTCREPYQVDGANLTHLGISLPNPSAAVPVWRPKGCKRCRNTGYHGRTGVFELLVVDHHIRSLVIKRTSGAQIRQSAISRGMATLSQSVWRKVASGETSLEELIRVLPAELR